MLRKVWANYNVSCIMVLPLFNTITEDIKYKNTLHTGYPFSQLCIDYGLKDTYIYKDDSKEFDGYLYLCFDQDIVKKNLKLTNSIHYSLFEMIINSPYYSSDNTVIIKENNKIIIPLKVPKRFHKDIEKIENGEYSKVSLSYKNEVKIRCKRIPNEEGVVNPLGVYISKNDLAYAICVKGLHVKQALEEALNTTIDLNYEFYISLNKNNEVLHHSSIQIPQKI